MFYLQFSPCSAVLYVFACILLVVDSWEIAACRIIWVNFEWNTSNYGNVFEQTYSSQRRIFNNFAIIDIKSTINKKQLGQRDKVQTVSDVKFHTLPGTGPLCWLVPFANVSHWYKWPQTADRESSRSGPPSEKWMWWRDSLLHPAPSLPFY